MLNKDLLFVNHKKHDQSDYKQIRWAKHHNRIHLVIPEVASKVGNTISLLKRENPYRAPEIVKKITPATFPILAMGKKDASYVIDVTDLFLNPPNALPGSGAVIFNDLASIQKVLAFDTTIEVKTHKTIVSEHGPLTEDADFSVFLLPEPMMPRLFDPRMGFQSDMYATGRSEESSKMAIVRWRLEKKYKNQVLSEPISPITLYFDPATPNKWKPYIKAGVEQWLPAFEAAGFKNAIVVKDPPIHDKNFSETSIRYSFIRWRDETNYRGRGSSYGTAYHIIDERTGEILQGNALIGGGYTSFADRYFIRCGPLDPRAHQYPFPDDLIGEFYQTLTAHEVGHVFGLIDGSYGEYMYPFENMRDKKWLEEMGHTPSVMNYARANFIPQPEDHIPPALLHRKVGPTDIYSMRWGYTPFKDAHTPDAELPYLETIVREQDSIPWYIFTKVGGPLQNTNDVVESNNPVKATALGVKNLQRVIQLISPATRNEISDKKKKVLYEKTLDLWSRQMKSVVNLLGGYTVQKKSGNQEGSIYTYVPAYRQKEAVDFLIKEAFHAPLWMAPQSLLSKFEPSGTEALPNDFTIISEKQKEIFGFLFQPVRLQNLEIINQTDKNGYSTIEFLEDIQEGLWSELYTRAIKINPYRRAIQIAHISRLKTIIEKKTLTNYTSFNSALKTLKKAIEGALKNTNDIDTKDHLELCLLEIGEF
jgi:hypothetical protein